MKQVSGQVKGFSAVVKQNSAQIKKMGRQMAVAGAAIIGTVGAMVKAYGSFNEAMVRSLAIMGDVSPAMRKEMAKTAKQLSTETTFAAKELAESYFFLASAGMDAAQSIAALPAVARFAQAGTFDLAQATDLLTDAQTALGLSTEDVVENEKNLIRVSDVLVGANTLANASVLQFSESLTNKAAAALVNVNKEVEEGVAVLAAYADKGVKGRIAGQRLTMMLNGLFDASRENKKAWDAVGISLFKADGSMRSIADIIQDMEGLLGNMTVKQREATLAALGFSIRTKDSILTLLGSSAKIRQWTGDLKTMGGITKEVADKQMEAFNAKMTVLKNVVVKAAIGIGQSLAPMIENLAMKIKNVAGRIATWIEKHPKLTTVIATLAVALGALLVVFGSLMMILPGLIIALPIIAAGFTALLGPIGLAVVAIAGVALVIKTLADNLKEAKGAMSAFADEAAVFANAAENFKKLWIIVRKEGGETLGQFNELMKRFGGNWEMIMGTIIRDPKFATLKALLLDIASGVKKVDLEGKNLSITLPDSFLKVEEVIVKSKPNFDRWATTIGKIFHDTSVRAAEMRAKMKDTKLIMPGIALTIPKMSLEDFTKFYEKWLRGLADKWEKQWEKILGWSQFFVSQLSGIFSQLTENQIINIENEFEARKKAIDNSLMSEKSKADAMEKLDKEFEKRRKKAMKAQAARTKVIGIMEAIIHTASAVVEALPDIPLAIAVGIMGAIQTALIAAQPLPTFAKGGSIAEGQAGIIGERGPELFVPDTAGTIVPLREGAGGALRPIFLSIAPTFQISAIDEIGVDEFMRLRGLPAMVEAIKVGIMKPELQDALRVK